MKKTCNGSEVQPSWWSRAEKWMSPSGGLKKGAPADIRKAYAAWQRSDDMVDDLPKPQRKKSSK